MKKVIVRGGPSPTSKFGLHVGNLRTLLYNYLYAKQNGGEFYIRIEDTDQGRFQEGAEELIRKSLEWLGLDVDYAPWKPADSGAKKIMRQSERDYSKYIKYLLDNGHAYYAFDSKEELEKVREENKFFSYNYETRMGMKNSLTLSEEEVNERIDSGEYVIRFKVPENVQVKFNDLIRGEMCFNSSELDDKILLKSNGIGSYHLCNVCDDHDMGTTHVIRGEEWLPSAPLHVLLYRAFGWDLPTFAHLPLIFNPPGHQGKLSKRKSVKLGFPIFPFGGKDVDDKGKEMDILGFYDEGYEPQALINYLALLGWSPRNDKEIMDMEYLVENFSFEAVNNSGAKFDIEKLKWFNSQYVNKLTIYDIFNEETIEFYGSEKLNKILEFAKERAVFRKDMKPIINSFIDFDYQYTDSSKINDKFKDVFKEFVDIMGSNTMVFEDPQKIKDMIYQIAVKGKGYRFGEIMPGLREALVGGISGPNLMETMVIIGKEETLKRLKSTI